MHTAQKSKPGNISKSSLPSLAAMLMHFVSLLFFFCLSASAGAQSYTKGKLLYTNDLAQPADTGGWRMEGKGELAFADNWMKMWSAGEKGHHVLWCPQQFPAHFIAEWEVQNLHPEAGLCIVFFAATGLQGEDIFDTTLPLRDGTFTQYTKGAINNYHISYYANGKDQPGRETAHLRKNKGFYLVQEKEPGIRIRSEEIHRMKLMKHQEHIQLMIDDRIVIDWQDDEKKYGAVLGGGKIGFRQMKWTHFQYRKLRVWECISDSGN